DEVFGERDGRGGAEAAAIRELRDVQGVPPLVARRRLAAFLARRGFPAEIILALCQKHCPQGEEINDQ
ncbi:MAG: hypothetical protein HY803_13185, partial [candidate division NC10 bacterium]|nr:hypothetical protein [candidate division NC10 bacterium]